MALVLDPITGALVDEKTLANKNKQEEITESEAEGSELTDDTETDAEASSETTNESESE